MSVSTIGKPTTVNPSSSLEIRTQPCKLVGHGTGQTHKPTSVLEAACNPVQRFPSAGLTTASSTVSRHGMNLKDV